MRKNIPGRATARSLIVVLLVSFCTMADPFQSAVISLAFPYGARTYAMGDVGVSLADDESVLYHNPAGLGIPNDRWYHGSASAFFERLLPALQIDDLWRLQTSFFDQSLPTRIGGLGLSYELLYFGENDLTNETGEITASFISHEHVLTLGWGFNLQELGIRHHYWGVSAKAFFSALVPVLGADGIGRGFALDFGYIFAPPSGVRLGFVFKNMGTPVFYGNSDRPDPIPFTVSLGVGYKREFLIDNMRFLSIATETKIEREITHKNDDGKPDPFWKAIYTDLFGDSTEDLGDQFAEAIYSIGAEATFANTVSLRTGFMYDWIGERYESRIGFGLSFFNHLRIDGFVIISPVGFAKEFNGGVLNMGPNDTHREGSHGVRHRQRGISVTLNRLWHWPEEDRTWWLKSE